MGILSLVIVGGIAGYLASIIMKTNASMGVGANIVVGVIGALIGGFLFSLFGGSDVNGINLYSLLVAVVGSVILLAIVKAFRGSPAS